MSGSQNIRSSQVKNVACDIPKMKCTAKPSTSKSQHRHRQHIHTYIHLHNIILLLVKVVRNRLRSVTNALPGFHQLPERLHLFIFPLSNRRMKVKMVYNLIGGQSLLQLPVWAPFGGVTRRCNSGTNWQLARNRADRPSRYNICTYVS